MLAPTTYKKDLERLYGRMLNHNPEILYKDPSKTKKLWNKMWQNEPFEIYVKFFKTFIKTLIHKIRKSKKIF